MLVYLVGHKALSASICNTLYNLDYCSCSICSISGLNASFVGQYLFIGQVSCTLRLK